MLVLGVQRQGEEASSTPLEAVGLAVLGLESCAAVALQDVDHFLDEVPLGRGLSAGRNVDEKNTQEVAPSFQMHEGSPSAHARPGLRFHLVQIDAEVLDDRYSLAFRPVEIGVTEEFGLFYFTHGSKLLDRWNPSPAV